MEPWTFCILTHVADENLGPKVWNDVSKAAEGQSCVLMSIHPKAASLAPAPMVDPSLFFGT